MFNWQSAPVSFQQWDNSYYGKTKKTSYSIFHVKEFPADRYQARTTEMGSACFTLEREYKTCYFPEKSEKLQRLKKRMITVLQPALGPGHECTMLLASNLAMPQWVSINCSQLYIPNIVCFTPHSVNQSNLQLIDFQTEYCLRGFIVLNERCLSFFWFENNNNLLDINHMCLRSAKLLRDIKLVPSLQELIFATNVEKFSMITSASRNNYTLNTFLYKFMQTPPIIEKRFIMQQNAKGIFACISNRIIIRSRYQNVFNCTNSQFISLKFLGDGLNDCAYESENDNINDETLYNCTEGSTYCHSLCFYKGCKCSPLYYLDRNKKCKSYASEEIVLNVLIHLGLIEETGVKERISNDLLVDWDTAAEEQSSSAYDTFHSCPDSADLPCLLGHSSCYKISDICIYIINELGKIVPCRTGSHLQNCAKFECNTHFKCPGYYCIPWSYTCDGKWDCPGGTDESDRNVCK